MSKPLRLLVVEDSEAEVAPLVRELRRHGYEPEAVRVDADGAMRDALQRQAWDVVIADHGLPGFDSQAALRVLQESGLDLPFIILSKTNGEEAAVTAMKAGAQDYLIKDHLTRLGRAVERELQEASVRRQRRETEQLLATHHEVTRILAEADTLVEAGAKILQAIAKNGGWEAGEIWTVDRQSDVLRCLEIWHTGSKPLGEFETRTRAMTFARGIGLPGRVWASGQPAWIEDVTRDANFPRAPLAAEAGLRGAIGFPIGLPIVVGREVMGVIVFFRTAPGQPEEKLLALLNAVGSQIGQYLVRQQADEELKKLSNAVQQTANCVLITNRQGVIEYVNPAFERTTGYAREDVIGKTPRLLKSGHHDGKYYETLWNTVLAGETFFAEFVNRKKSGELYHTEQSITPIRNTHGHVTHFVSTGRDITERKQAEIRIQRLNRVYAILSDINQAIVRVREPQKMFEAACRIAVEQGGFRMAWIGLADSARKSVKLVAHAGVPDDFREKLKTGVGDDPRGRGPTAIALRDGTPVVCNDLEHDPRLTRSSEDAQRLGYCALAVLPLTVDGEKAGTFNLYASEPGVFDDEEMRLLDELAMDIGFALEMSQHEAQRQWAEAERLQLGKQMQLLLESTGEGIYGLDLEGRCTFINRAGAEMAGYTPEEMLGRRMHELIHHQRKDGAPYPAEECPIFRVFQTGERCRIDAEVYWRRDGTAFPVEYSAHPILEAGAIHGAVVMFADLTEKKKIETQFMRTQRLESIGTLAGGIAHDLNNALSPIHMGLHMLRSKYTAEDDQWLLDTMESSAQRGIDMVRQVLAFSRGTEGARGAVQLKHLLREIRMIITHTFPKYIETEVNAPNELWTVMGDATQLHQVLMNLCVNARDAMPHGGRLTINAENLMLDEHYVRMNVEARIGPYLVITVTDTGTGIPPKVLERIFEPFFTTKELGKGTGLGLSTVRGIVKNHGGFVTVYSEVGKGSQFKVYLPAEQTEATQRAQKEQKALPAGKGELILVVDDEAGIRDVTKQALEMYGYQVLLAGNGAEAVAVCAQNIGKIKLMLTDMMMPIMDGMATVHAVRTLDPQIRIIAASGLGEEAGTTASEELGVNAFLHKPYTADRLLQQVHEVLQGGKKPWDPRWAISHV